MPSWQFWCYARMLERLQAEEQLGLLPVIQAATGRMANQASQRLMRALQQQARGGQQPAARRPSSLEELQALGVKVEQE